MDWIKLQQQVIGLYNAVAEWCFDHQTETDFIAGTLIIGSVLVLRLRQDRMRRRLRRIWWGKTMRRTKNRLAYEKTMIAFNLEEMLIDMAYRGELTDKSAEEWRQSFKNAYNLEELNPRKNQHSIKKSIRGRMKRGVFPFNKHAPPNTGGPPAVKVDLTYKPVAETKMEKSKWAA